MFGIVASDSKSQGGDVRVDIVTVSSVEHIISLPARIPQLLWCLNFTAVMTHAAIVTATIVLFSPSVTLPVTRTSTNFSMPYTWSTLHKVGDFPLFSLILAFSLITCLAHLYQIVRFETYLNYVRACRAPLRWLEYAVTAPIMALLIAQLCFILDVWLQLSIVMLTVSTIFFGHLTEVTARPASDFKWTMGIERFVPHVFGYCPQCLVWTIIIFTFHDAVQRFNDDVDSPGVPSFVYIVVYGEVAMFWSFGVVQLVILCLAPQRYWTGEIAYIILSLTSKVFLSVLCLANVAQMDYADWLPEL